MHPIFVIPLLGLATVLVVPLLILVGLRVHHFRHLRRVRRSLLDRAGRPDERFDPASLADLPEPVRRYFEHAIAPGTPLASAVSLRMQVRVRQRKHDPEAPWWKYRQVELLTPWGFWIDGRQVDCWPPNRATFYYFDHRGEGREAWYELLPALLNTDGSFARLLRIRLLHHLVWLPSALLPREGVTWRADGDDAAEVTLTLDGETTTVRLVLDDDGRVREAITEQWIQIGTPERRLIPVRLVLDGERRFDGYTVPTRMLAGWWHGTPKYVESMEFTVLDADYGVRGEPAAEHRAVAAV